MRKITISLAIVSGLVLAGVGAQGVYSYNTCGYNVFTGNYESKGKFVGYNVFTDSYESKGKEYAYGRMEDAYNCALFGLLPYFVEQRLGKYGDKDAKIRADEIIETNRKYKESTK
jgi:hypothetical protein